jgi:hypothetical protein
MRMFDWIRLRRRSADLRHRFVTDTIDALDFFHHRLARIEEQLQEQQTASRELERRTSRAETAASVARLEVRDLIQQYVSPNETTGLQRLEHGGTPELGQPSELLESLMPILTPIRSRRAAEPPHRPEGEQFGVVEAFAYAAGLPDDEDVQGQGLPDGQGMPNEAALTNEEGEYICFFATPDGYDLLERPGAAPVVGSTIDVGEGRHGQVVKVARSPLPNDGRRCAYLLPVTTDMALEDEGLLPSLAVSV